MSKHGDCATASHGQSMWGLTEENLKKVIELAWNSLKKEDLGVSQNQICKVMKVREGILCSGDPKHEPFTSQGDRHVL